MRANYHRFSAWHPCLLPQKVFECQMSDGCGTAWGFGSFSLIAAARFDFGRDGG